MIHIEDPVLASVRASFHDGGFAILPATNNFLTKPLTNVRMNRSRDRLDVLTVEHRHTVIMLRGFALHCKPFQFSDAMLPQNHITSHHIVPIYGNLAFPPTARNASFNLSFLRLLSSIIMVDRDLSSFPWQSSPELLPRKWHAQVRWKN